jgi:3-hydroxybutyryl-CoA dehydratase
MKYEDYEVGYKGSYTKAVTEEDNAHFAKLSGDFNPIHFEDVVGRAAGFQARISNGFVQESRIAAALVETFGKDGTIVVALEKNTRFLKPVYIGDRITATVEVVGRVPAFQALRIKAGCYNQKNEQVVSTEMLIKIVAVAAQVKK